jgi:hypothetical protein
MVAIYPTSIKSFAYRQDYTELVEAADVNVAYDEINAVENTLGVLPNSDTLDNAVVTWPSVKANISAARSGVTNPICKVRAVDIPVPYSFNNGTGSGTIPNYSYATWDTHGMWQGGGILKCPRTGWYSVSLYTEWQFAAQPYDFEQPTFEHSGYAQVGVQIPAISGGLYITGYNYSVQQGAQFAIRESAAIETPWFQGQNLNIDLFQTYRSSTTAPCNVYLSVSYLRAAPTTNNM